MSGAPPVLNELSYAEPSTKPSRLRTGAGHAHFIVRSAGKAQRRSKNNARICAEICAQSGAVGEVVKAELNAACTRTQIGILRDGRRVRLRGKVQDQGRICRHVARAIGRNARDCKRVGRINQIHQPDRGRAEGVRRLCGSRFALQAAGAGRCAHKQGHDIF